MNNTTTNLKDTGSYDFDSVSEKSYQLKEISYPNQIFQIFKIKNKKKWTKEEDGLLIKLAEKYKEKHWKEISSNFQNKNALQCFSRYKRIRPGIVKGSWKKEEDEKILKLVQIYGKSWSKISKILITRNGKQIRDRFINVLDPEIKKGKFTDDEDKLLIRLYLYYGPKWATICKHYNNRTADMIKNRFHSSIKKVFFMDNGVTMKKNFNVNNFNMNWNNIQENNSACDLLEEDILRNGTINDNVNMTIGEELITMKNSKLRDDKFSQVSQVKHNKTRQCLNSNQKSSQSLSPQNITNSRTISFSLENLPLSSKEKFSVEEISQNLKEEEQLTTEELDRIKEMREVLEYKDYHMTLKENDICNTKNNSNANDNLYLNDDYNLIHFNEDCDYSHQDNYANMFHFEDYFSF